jgi:hypothetical protein
MTPEQSTTSGSPVDAKSFICFHIFRSVGASYLLVVVDSIDIPTEFRGQVRQVQEKSLWLYTVFPLND